MFWLTLYLVTTYSAVWLLYAAVRRNWKRRPRFRAILLRCLWLLPLLPYAVIALQTACFGRELRPYVVHAMRDTGMMAGEPVTLRVMTLRPGHATVFVTERCGSPRGGGQAANLLTLRRSVKGWVLDSWDTVWSACGSADGNTFPPFPEASEF